jgi:hypothetical protein
LTAEEQSLFSSLISNTEPEHFRPTDAPLLTAYVRAILLAEHAVKRAIDDPASLVIWEKSTRLLNLLAARLRLCPQSRLDGRVAAKPRLVRRHGLLASAGAQNGALEMSRGVGVITWCEGFCLEPDGPAKGQPVRLSNDEKLIIRHIYDAPDGPHDIPVTGRLAAFLALVHLCGREALRQEFRPTVDVDTWSIWRATSPALRRVLKRKGEFIVCPELGTAYPRAA